MVQTGSSRGSAWALAPQKPLRPRLHAIDASSPAPPDPAYTSRYNIIEMATPFARVHSTSYIAFVASRSTVRLTTMHQHATFFEDAVANNYWGRASFPLPLPWTSSATAIIKQAGDAVVGCAVCFLGQAVRCPLSTDSS